MIRTKEEMHHSTGNVPSCPAHPACTAGCCQERRMDRDLCQYKHLPPSMEHRKAPDRLLWEQWHLQARREQGRAPTSQERVGLEPHTPVPGRDLRGRRRTHRAAQGSGDGQRPEAAAPGPAELRQPQR